MTLFQIYVSSATNNNYFPTSYSGDCFLELLNIQYTSTNVADPNHLIAFTSDAFRLPYGLSYFLFNSKPNANLNYTNNGKIRTILNGQILIKITDTSTGIEPVNFSNCLLTFSLKPITPELLKNMHESYLTF
jgi:hypothetical protein